MKGKTIRTSFLCIFGALSVILLISLDQYTKVLARLYLEGRPSRVLIPGVLELKHLENAGAAWGMFAGKTWIFLAICLLFFAAAIILFIRIPRTTYYLPLHLLLFLMVSGAAGNFIDRLSKGTVTDFIYLSLIDFPVFNLADVYVVSSAVLLILFVCIKYKNDDFEFLSLKHRG